MNTHWWQVLPAIPLAKDTLAYRRLARVWRDRTRFHGKRETDNGRRYQEFVKPTHETHLTATLWENFVLFEPSVWLSRLMERAGLAWHFGRIEEMHWSYEWEFKVPQTRIADVVIHCKVADGSDVIVVVESKNLGKGLASKDQNLSTYLDSPLLLSMTDKRILLYLVDESVKPTITTEIREDGCLSGIVTWQQLGGLQIELARELDLPPTVSAFIAGSIQQQFCAHDILPDVLAFDYLKDEPSMQEVDDDIQNKQTQQEREKPLWLIPER